jgi:hypothetical protein
MNSRRESLICDVPDLIIYRYLPSYPYIVSAPLHTYAGLLSFYLAQPHSARPSQAHPQSQANTYGRPLRSVSSSPDLDLDMVPPPREMKEPPNQGLMRSANVWFAKALEIDGEDTVAREYIRLVSIPCYRLYVKYGCDRLRSLSLTRWDQIILMGNRIPIWKTTRSTTVERTGRRIVGTSSVMRLSMVMIRTMHPLVTDLSQWQ